MKNLLVVCFFVFNLLPVYGQTSLAVTDTFNIYKNKAGIRFSKYLRQWFSDYGIGNEYSWDPSRMNMQDSLVMNDHTPCYFKVYDAKGRLLFEGLSGIWTFMQGDIRFYYRSGQLKRIEHWDNQGYHDSCMGEVKASFHDAPGREGCWKYYRKKGSLYKQRDYLFKVYSCQPLNYGFVRQTTRYRKGKIKSVREKKIQ